METILKRAVQIVIINFIIFFAMIVYLNFRQVKPTGVIVTPTVIATSTTVDLFQQVSQHNTQGDCWIIINGHIYNITSYFGSHPGGDNMLVKYCGQDAKVGFNTKDKNQAQAHSSAAQAILQQYLIK